MKKYSFIPLLLCASTLALAGCNLGGSSSKKSSKKKSSSTETSQVSGSSQAGGSSASSASQGGGTSATSTSSGGGSSQFTALGIMTDIATWAWGGTEDGDFADPDDKGVIVANYTIGMEVDSPEDSESCLNGVLNSMTSDSEWPLYLSVADGPKYTANAITDVTPNLGVSEIYLITTDQEFILYMYDYCYNGAVNVYFEAGPTSAYSA